VTDVMLTPAELADRWHVSAETVRKMCRDQELGHLPIGRKYLIPESEAERYEEREFIPARSAEHAPSVRVA
jgi:excisionase family DNA binding protein